MKRLNVIIGLLFAAMLVLVFIIAEQSEGCEKVKLKPLPFESTTPHPLDVSTIKNWHVTESGAVMILFQDGAKQLHAVLTTGVCRATIKGETALTYDGDLCYIVSDIPLMMFGKHED